MASESVTSHAIVLRTVPYRDADLIVMLYTRERGRVSALARAARKSRKRFGAALQLFTVSNVSLSRRGGDLWTLKTATSVHSFADLAHDMARFAHASYGTELIRELTALEQPDDRMFDLVLSLYVELKQRDASSLVLRAFELEVLSLVGLAPVLERCVGCGLRDLDERGTILDPNRGGVCCTTCAALSRDVGVRQLSHGALCILQALKHVDTLAEARSIEVASRADANEARDTLVALITRHIGKPLRSLEFIVKVSAAARQRRGDG